MIGEISRGYGLGTLEKGTRNRLISNPLLGCGLLECRVCGTPNLPEDRFCSRCGAQLVEIPSSGRASGAAAGEGPPGQAVVQCQGCKGTGRHSAVWGVTQVHGPCGGKGWIRTGPGPMETRRCGYCGGSGSAASPSGDSAPCLVCKGTGTVEVG